jgi:hypothetical protein
VSRGKAQGYAPLTDDRERTEWLAAEVWSSSVQYSLLTHSEGQLAGLISVGAMVGALDVLQHAINSRAASPWNAQPAAQCTAVGSSSTCTRLAAPRGPLMARDPRASQ